MTETPITAGMTYADRAALLEILELSPDARAALTDEGGELVPDVEVVLPSAAVAQELLSAAQRLQLGAAGDLATAERAFRKRARA